MVIAVMHLSEKGNKARLTANNALPMAAGLESRLMHNP
jgi:hypothetical protein